MRMINQVKNRDIAFKKGKTYIKKLRKDTLTLHSLPVKKRMCWWERRQGYVKQRGRAKIEEKKNLLTVLLQEIYGSDYTLFLAVWSIKV